jgi:hypothetical protein
VPEYDDDERAARRRAPAAVADVRRRHDADRDPRDAQLPVLAGRRRVLLHVQRLEPAVGGQKVSLFGNTLLAGMLTVFDVANQKIGFALQTGCAEANVAHRPMVVRRPTIDPAVAAHLAQLAL